MNPRASFVIPAYNAARWISKAIHSCRTQSIKQIEIIVVNDGSSDATKEICEWHAKEDSRVKVFNTINQGRSAARNFGNKQAEAELLLVLDSDDLATRNRVKDTIAAFQLKKCDFLYGSFFLIDSLGNTERRIVSSAFDPVISKETKLNHICHSTVAYTKTLALDVKYEDGEWSKLGLDDWKFQWEAHRKGYAIKNIRNPLCYYRLTSDGTVATRDTKAVDHVKDTYLATI